MNFCMATIHSTLQSEQTRRELARLLPPDLPLDLEGVFPRLEGWGMRRANRKRAELLAKAASVVKAALTAGERVRYVASGIVSLWWELALAGWVSLLINRTTIVLTDQRLLLIHVDRRGAPESYANEVKLTAIRRVKRGWLGSSLRLELGQRSRSFTSMRRQDTEHLRRVLPARREAVGGLAWLCPACFQAAVAHGRCARCRTPVKSPGTAALRSLVLPGLGDFYLGHRVLAALEMLGAMFAWVVVISLLLPAMAEATGVWPFFASLAGIATVLLVNGFDAVLTYWQAKKGLYSMDGHLPTASPSGIR